LFTLYSVTVNGRTNSMKIRLNKTVVTVAASALLLMAVPAVGVASASGASAKPVYTIGVEGPFTGPDSFLGNPVFGGAELAVNAANAAGLPFTLKVSKFDDQCSGSVSPAEAQKEVATAGLVGIVGPVCSGATEAALPYLKAANLADVSPSATAVALATNGGSFFRVTADDSVQGAADASYLVKTLGVKNLLVIGDSSFYGNGLAQVVAADAKADGATVTTQTIANVNSGGGGTAAEYAPDATAIATSNPGGIFYGGYASDFGMLLGALANAGYTASSTHPIMSGDGSNETALMTDTSPSSAANNVYLSQSASTSVNYFTGALATAYQKLTKQKASAALYAAQAYDAANAIINALKGVSAGSLASVRKNVLLNLRAISFTGVTGNISFAANGNLRNDAGSVAISQVQKGNIVPLTTVAQ
jgi:branched-chain amino acid transport system substrate-binding protein